MKFVLEALAEATAGEDGAQPEWNAVTRLRDYAEVSRRYSFLT